MSKQLTKVETGRLTELESVVSSGLQTFAEVGNALLEIRDTKLYRIEFGTFDEYCKERWGIQDRRARRLMSASEVIGNIEKSGPIGPLSESQTRLLSKLPPAQQPETRSYTGLSSARSRTTAKSDGD